MLRHCALCTNTCIAKHIYCSSSHQSQMLCALLYFRASEEQLRNVTQNVNRSFAESSPRPSWSHDPNQQPSLSGVGSCESGSVCSPGTQSHHQGSSLRVSAPGGSSSSSARSRPSSRSSELLDQLMAEMEQVFQNVIHEDVGNYRLRSCSYVQSTSFSSCLHRGAWNA